MRSRTLGARATFQFTKQIPHIEKFAAVCLFHAAAQVILVEARPAQFEVCLQSSKFLFGRVQKAHTRHDETPTLGGSHDLIDVANSLADGLQTGEKTIPLFEDVAHGAGKELPDSILSLL